MTESTGLSLGGLRELVRSFRSGPLSVVITVGGLRQACGEQEVGAAESLVGRLTAAGMTAPQIAIALELALEARAGALDPARLIELVLSGPEVAGVPASDTRATIDGLIASARREILLVGYAVHNGKELFEPLARRMQRSKGLSVTKCLDIPRQRQDTSLESEIVLRFGHEFRSKHWPWPDTPRLYYDPRALSTDQRERASLHAKCVVVDGEAALITSANFTTAAQQRNIEVGVLVRYPPLVGRLEALFRSGVQAGWLRQCTIPK